MVLLGETHDNAAHHRWQLHTIAGLHALRPDLALGFEMFPRRIQPVLERWTNGALSEAAFLAEVEWERVWVSTRRSICRCSISPARTGCR